MTSEQFRRLALEIPGALESGHMGHPDFRLHGKIFATLGAPDEDWGMIKLTPEQQQSQVQNAPGVFKPCNGAWGLHRATYVHLATVPADLLRAVIVTASRNLPPNTQKRPTRKPKIK